MSIEELEVRHRVFIVGCPRSGTTLLQGMMGMHPCISTFPETHFFDRAFPSNFIKSQITWPALNVQGVMEEFLVEVGRPDLVGEAKISRFTRNYGAKFVKILDRIALESDTCIWVEKTPKHLHFIEAITEQVPNSKFLHIVRQGVDVIASLFEITNRDPKAWTMGRRPGFKGFSVEECIDLWNTDLRITQGYRGHPDHLVIRFESLIENPRASLCLITDFLGIRFETRMLRPEKLFSEIVRPREPWKARNAQPIHRPESKFKRVFSEDTQRFIQDRLLKVDL